ncbi:hypothetical protein [Actinoallomurus rhizosphaericola]|uniref:hypothetical protein n=1 Tax=Actinoallomurus rhizosphaericola TaxID=2952536 RepID=UPI0020926092|nr:hypothetical protein [Actinoallomurus rhizosphaericola]MCO5997322.1 hypothetical protein [Actinoallomurus rhizosphaericola]
MTDAKEIEVRSHAQRSESVDRSSGKRRRIALGSAVGATLMTAMTFAATPSPASASITPFGCGATYAKLYNGSQVVWQNHCSSTGNQYSVPNLWATKLVANGWSGAVYGTDNRIFYFCYFQTITVNDYVRQVFLNPTKPARCG